MENAGTNNYAEYNMTLYNHSQANTHISRLPPKTSLSPVHTGDCRVEICIRKYDDGVYSQIEFLRPISHSVAQTDVLWLDDMTASDTDDDNAQGEAPTSSLPEYENAATETCEVCLLQPRSAVALVPCGHSRFCGACADVVAALDSGCPLCRCLSRMVLRLYN